jgi:hypothetical protein
VLLHWMSDHPDPCPIAMAVKNAEEIEILPLA